MLKIIQTLYACKTMTDLEPVIYFLTVSNDMKWKSVTSYFSIVYQIYFLNKELSFYPFRGDIIQKYSYLKKYTHIDNRKSILGLRRMI